MEIKIDNVTYAYRKGRNALRELTAELGPGIHLVLGPNGAGKTTMLRLVAGLLVPQEGECCIDSDDVANHSPRTIKDVFLLEEQTEYPLTTVNEMAQRHGRFYARFSRDTLEGALAAFGMDGNEPLAGMSLGSRHKANVAYALALGTRVLLLDEPANALDMASKQTLTSLIAKAMMDDEERTIIVATHTVQEMRNLFDTVTVVDHGKAVINASTADIAERLAFINDPRERDDALVFVPNLDGPTQVVPNGEGLETPIDYTLLYLAATGSKSDILKEILK